MSKAPALPFYVDAYLADTTHLTLEEHGAYIILLAAMWRRDGTIPDDDRDNARILGVTIRKWRRIKERLLPLLESWGPENEKVLSQKRLLREWNYVAEKKKKDSQKARDAAKARWKENKELADAMHGCSKQSPKQAARDAPSNAQGYACDMPPNPNKSKSLTQRLETPRARGTPDLPKFLDRRKPRVPTDRSPVGDRPGRSENLTNALDSLEAARLGREGVDG